MLQKALATNFTIETEFDGEECKYRCELLDEKRMVWKCEFPRKMSLFNILNVIEEMFSEEYEDKTGIIPQIIKFNFNGTEVITRFDNNMTVLEEVTRQIKLK